MKHTTMTLCATFFALIFTICAAPQHARAEEAGTTTPSPWELFASSYALEARRAYRGALNKTMEVSRLLPSDYVVRLRLGWLLYQNQRYPEAAAAYRRAVELRPRALEPKLGLMLPLMAIRRHQEALNVADSILKIAPSNFLARSRKAYLLYQLGRYAKAENEYRAVLELFPSNVEMMSGLGWARLKQGKIASARSVFERLVKISPNHASGKAGLETCR